MDYKVIGQRVRMMRLEKNLQQRDLARAAGVTAKTLGGLERGTQQTRPLKIDAIARALGTTIELLMQGEPMTEDHPLLRGLTEEDLRVARAHHDTSTPIRLAVQRVLAGEITPRVLTLAERIQRLPVEDQQSHEEMVAMTERQPAPSVPTKKPRSKNAS